MASVDLYNVLGVEPEATCAQIKQAYRERALRTHPDTSTAPDAKEAFEVLTEAYTTLSDPRQRMMYDAGRPRTSLASPSAYEASTGSWDINCDLADLPRPDSTRGPTSPTAEDQRRRWRDQANSMEQEGTEYNSGDSEAVEEQNLLTVFGPSFIATFVFFALVLANDSGDTPLPRLDPFDLLALH
jgi:curved DNA-binding protein CbpA